jgi:dolichol-phosphate mannosyltransferase
MRIGIVLPTFNVGPTVSRSLTEIYSLIHDGYVELLLIDNSSTDHTVSEVRNFFSENPTPFDSCHFKLNNQNLGYGDSIKSGFNFFRNRPVSHVMVLHSDAQTNNYLLARSLIEAYSKTSSDVILGSRFSEGIDVTDYNLLRRVGNHFFNRLTKLSSGHAFSDAGTAMVLLKRDCLDLIDYNILSSDWKFHPQLNIKFGSLQSLSIEEVPMKWSDSKVASSVPLIRYGASLFWFLIQELINRTFRLQSQTKGSKISLGQLDPKVISTSEFLEQGGTSVQENS